MIARSPTPVMVDILTALEGIRNATKGKTFEQFSGDWVLRHAVQRGIEIISEAVRQLSPELLETQPQIPWSKIKGVGNILRHEYHKVADPILWAVVTEHLPPLRLAMALMLQDFGRSDEMIDEEA